MRIAVRTQQRKNLADITGLSTTQQCLAYLEIVMIIMRILIVADRLPGLILLAFVTMIFHTLWQIWISKADLKIMREGWIQVGLSIVFALLVVISYRR